MINFGAMTALLLFKRQNCKSQPRWTSHLF